MVTLNCAHMYTSKQVLISTELFSTQVNGMERKITEFVSDYTLTKTQALLTHINAENWAIINNILQQCIKGLFVIYPLH